MPYNHNHDMVKTTMVFALLGLLMLLVVALVSLPLIGDLGLSSNVRTTNTSTTFTTEPNGTTWALRTWGPWSFKLSMNSTSVRIGGVVNLSGRLTYLGNANTMVDLVSSVFDASVYNSTGDQVWEWFPSQITTLVTVHPGESFGQPVCLPLLTLNATEQNITKCFFNFWEPPVPGVYSVVAEPVVYSASGQDLGTNLQISLSLVIA